MGPQVSDPNHITPPLGFCLLKGGMQSTIAVNIPVGKSAQASGVWTLCLVLLFVLVSKPGKGAFPKVRLWAGGVPSDQHIHCSWRGSEWRGCP